MPGQAPLPRSSPPAVVGGGQRRELRAYGVEIVGHRSILGLTAPFFAMCFFGSLANLVMAAREQQRTGVANLGLDDAEVAGCVEQARIPPFPVRQQGFDFFAKAHGRNVTERPGQDNDGGL